MRMFLILTCLLVGVGYWSAPAASGEKRIPVATSDEGKVPVGKLKPGDASPEFMAVDSNRRLVSLKDFKGKYVFIDVWATWCAPCVGQIPHLQRLEKLFKGKKIVFVSISCDEDVDEWLGYLRKNKMEGVQLNFDCNRRFQDAYGVKAIPRFILLDKKGRVVNPNMTRPSDPETEKTLNALKGI